MLAQRTHAPNLLLIFEAGGVGPQVPVLPASVGDSRTFHRAVVASTMHDVMSALQHGYVDYGFLGAAAMDAYGNINTTGCAGDQRANSDGTANSERHRPDRPRDQEGLARRRQRG
jgi:acyl CoA:acetate/3-ketoacid CoA transferase beta subunit